MEFVTQHRSRLSIGIDVGKRHDPTAIAVAVADERKGDGQGGQEKEKGETHFVIPFLRRIDLGTPYPEQARMLVDWGTKALHKFVQKTGFHPPKPPEIYVDVTGVGDALVDLLVARHIERVGALYPCRFVAGDHIKPGREYSIGKTNFISRLQVLAESKRVHLPSTPEAQTLAREMLDFDIDVDEMSGKPTYGAIRPGTHDDMVVALGLACLEDLPVSTSVAFYSGGGHDVSPDDPRTRDPYGSTGNNGFIGGRTPRPNF
jgi:hypothetical protein